MSQEQSILSNLFIVSTLVHEFGHAICIRNITRKYKISYEPSIILIGSEYVHKTKPKYTIKLKNYIIKFYGGNQGKGYTLSPHFVNFKTEEISKAAIAGHHAENRFIHVFCGITYVIFYVLLFTLNLSCFENVVLLAATAMLICGHAKVIKDNNRLFAKSKDYQNYRYPEKFDCQDVKKQYYHYKNLVAQDDYAPDYKA